MVGWHTLIGIGEAADHRPGGRSVVAVRPDLGLRRSRCWPARNELEIREAVALMTRRRFFAVGLLLALLVAGFGSYYASSHPDGLEFVAGKTGFLDTAEEPRPPTARSPTTRTRASTTSGSVAGSPGVAGVLMVLVLEWAGLRLRRPPARARRDRS